MFSEIEKKGIFEKPLKAVKDSRGFFCSGITDALKPLFYSFLIKQTEKKFLIITRSESVFTLSESINELLKGEFSAPYPEDDSFIYQNLEPSIEAAKARASALISFLSGNIRAIVTDINAVSEKTAGLLSLKNSFVSLKKGEKYGFERILNALNENGYERRIKVAECFEYSVRGSIIDIFPPGERYPVRIEFDGDTVLSLRAFSIDSYATEHEMEKCNLMLYNPASGGKRGDSSLTDYFEPEETFIVLDSVDELKKEIKQKIESLTFHIKDSVPWLFSFGEISKKISRFSVIKASMYHGAYPNAFFCIKPEANPAFNRDTDAFIRYASSLIKDGYSVYAASDNEAETRHLREISGEVKEKINFINASLSEGFVLKSHKVCLISNREIFQRYKGSIKEKRKSPKKFSSKLSGVSELSPGDFVVHRDHGIGIFEGVKTVTVDEITADFILLKYAGDDKLYLPIYRIDLIDKYIGSDGLAPALSKLGTQVFRRTREQIKEELERMARELLNIYAGRKTTGGIKFSDAFKDSAQADFNAAFIHEETPDQAKAIVDVLSDMASARQMDRLVCGDAGFGKTEVAMRAAFRAVSDGYQVVVLTATTLLCAQHENTFKERMADYPIKVCSVSRMTEGKKRKIILKEIEEGKCDIVIGTHAILSSKIKLKKPGLVIIDEEQHFGVKHKEMLRKIYPQCDILTLTATPIPRTLYLSLSGIRDISVINTPPPLKKSIETFVIKERLSALREIILREIMRKGQVFYIYNNVGGIYKEKEKLETLVPGVKFAVAHGQMEKKQLEAVISDFLLKKYDVLISTTIVESGLDMPDVNTIIISNAERFGLSQLYQLRGRVGRREKQAFAYLMVKDMGALTEQARERLRAIESYVDPGAGFAIAMRDLEIRGAGNILGTKQHGNMEKIGFEMYCRMLEEAVHELRGETVEGEKDTKISAAYKAFIPEEYMWDTGEKVRFYRAMFMAEDFSVIDEIKRSIKDIWGEMPEEAENLLTVAKLKIAGRRLKADEIVHRKGEFVAVYWNNPDEMPQNLIREARKIEGVIYQNRTLTIKAQDFKPVEKVFSLPL